MSKPIMKDEADLLLRFRKELFAVEIEPEKFPLEEGQIRLSVTTNGYQWMAISLLKSEVPKVIKALKDATRKPLK